MCGISGWIDWEVDVQRHPQVLEEMRDALAHRGPDAKGSWVSPRAAMLHRRLTVVDPKGGAQPMAAKVGGRECVITYNGELYNTEDVRAQLLVKGYSFRGYSDTEVLLNAYIEWGQECLGRLNGIFAFAIWDAGRQELFLARDRLGVKPLFYHESGSMFLFGSEIKAILAHPGVPREIEACGIAEILVMGPARTPGCGIFRGIQELRPGCYLRCRRSGTAVGRYWRLTSRPHEDDERATIAQVRHLLKDTVERQLVSDVPVCTFLSGGLDSSAVSAITAAAFARDGKGNLSTFSVDYQDQDRHFHSNRFQPDVDAPWVARVSGYLGTQHTNVVLDTPALVEALRLSMRANDLPGYADVDSSLLLFCRQVKQRATVALSGEAADEIFGGYPWFRDPEALGAGTFPWAVKAHERAQLLAPEVAAQVRPLEYVSDRYAEALAEVPRLAGEDHATERVREMYYLNITRFMPALLDRKDRMSMATGLEVRVPYCDHRIVEYLWNVPEAIKSTGGREKGLLRQAMRGILPDDVLQRRKSPYPKTHNPAYRAAVRSWLTEVLNDPASPLLPLLDSARIKEILSAGGEGFGPAWFGQLMGGAQLFAYLAQTDLWLREYRIRLV